MTSHQSALDDLEVRQQHRRQIRNGSVAAVVGSILYWGAIFVLMAAALWSQRATSPTAPGYVIAVDPVHDVVEVSYRGEGSRRQVVDVGVQDASRYHPGDHVDVLIEAETLDREPLRPIIIRFGRDFALAVLVTSLIGLVCVAFAARVRRRELASPWRRERGESWHADRSFAFLPRFDDGSFWKLSEDLPTEGAFDADVAGDSRRRLVLRVTGSHPLVTARRHRTGAWSRHRVLAWGDDGSAVACAIEDVDRVVTYQLDGMGAARPDHVDLLHGPGRSAMRAQGWPVAVTAIRLSVEAARERWLALPELTERRRSEALR
jgi:hypothetical protein